MDTHSASSKGAMDALENQMRIEKQEIDAKTKDLAARSRIVQAKQAELKKLEDQAKVVALDLKRKEEVIETKRKEIAALETPLGVLKTELEKLIRGSADIHQRMQKMQMEQKRDMGKR